MEYCLERAAKMGAIKPEIMEAYMHFDEKVFAEGSLNVQTKELIALACAHITQCEHCIEVHTKNAKDAGATPAKIAEAIFVAAAMRAGAAIVHSCIAMGSLEE
jgi:AhpD family alkylhydroperoxidase